MSANQIKEPGVYSIPHQVYLDDPCVVPSASNHALQTLLFEAAGVMYADNRRLNPEYEEPDAEERFDRGAAAHILILGDEQRFSIIQADSYRTKDAKDARARAYAEGKVPILAEKWAEVVKMADAAKRQLAQHEDAADIFSNGKPEQTLVWIEKVRGADVWCRAKLDYIPDNRGRPYGDYKSVAANINPDVLSRYASTANWNFQAAWYCRGIRAVLGETAPEFKFVVQQPYAPYLLQVVDLPMEAMEIGHSAAELALDYWAFCQQNGGWPGYPRRTVTLDWPKWAGEQVGAIGARVKWSRENDIEPWAGGSMWWRKP